MATGTEVARLFVRVGADVTEVIAATTLVNSKISSMSTTVMAAGGIIAGAGALMTVGLTAPIVNLGKQTAETAATYEQKMNLIKAVSGSTAEEMEVVSKATLNVGASTSSFGIDALKAADAVTELLRAGLNLDQIYGDVNAVMDDGSKSAGALQAAIELSAASNLDMGEAAEFVVQVMSTFGVKADELDGIIDRLVGTANSSVLEMDDLAASWKNAAPTTAIFGLSIDDLNTSLALMSQHGIRGAEAGTALKRMLTNIQRPTESVTTALDELGISIYDANGNIKDMRTITGEFSNALFGAQAQTRGMTEEQRNLYIQTIAGVYGMKALNALLVGGVPAWDAMTTSIKEQSTAEEVAQAKMEGYKGATTMLQKALIDLKIKAGTPLIENVLTPMVKQLTLLITKINDADPRFFELAIKIGLVLAAAGPFLIIVGALTVAIGAIMTPVGAVTAGLVALAAIVGAVAVNMALAKDKSNEFATVSNGPLSESLRKLKDLWDVVWGGIQRLTHEIFDDLRPFIQKMLGDIKSFFLEEFGVVTDWIETNLPLIQSIIEKVVDRISYIWHHVWPDLRVVLETSWETMKVVIDTALKTILGVIKTVMQILDGDWKGAWNTIKETTQTMMDGTKKVVETQINGVVKIMKDKSTEMGLNTEQGWNSVALTVGNSMDRITGEVERGYVDSKGVVRTQMTEMESLSNQQWAAIRDSSAAYSTETRLAAAAGFNGMKDDTAFTWENIRIAVSEAWGFVKEDVSNGVASVNNVMSTAWDGVKASTERVWNGIWNTLTSGWDYVKRTVQSAINEITSWFNNWSPHIKLPHFTITWQRTGNNLFPEIPIFNIQWYGQGVDAVFNKPTLIGVGEKGAERVQVTPLGRGGGGSNSTTNNNNQREFSYNITIQASPENVMPAMRALLMKLQMGTTG